MIGLEDSVYTYEYDDHYKILPSINEWYLDQDRIKKGTKVKTNFVYSSNKNVDWMKEETLQNWISDNSDLIGKY